MIYVSAEVGPDGTAAVKLQDDAWELNVRAPAADFGKLRDIQHTTQPGQSLAMGRCAHAPVWWNEQDGQVNILIGPDDVTWDAAVTVPLATARDIVRAVEQELQQASS